MKMLSKKKRAVVSYILMLTLVFVSLNFTAFAELQSDRSTKLAVVPQGFTGVYTKDELNNIRNNPSGKFILMNDINLSAADYANGGSLYNNGEGWVPIGESLDNAFTGIFNGNGYNISGLNINMTADLSDTVCGLFGYNKGTIQNLGIINSSIKLTVSSPLNKIYVGAVAGYNDANSKILNCYNNGSVSIISEYIVGATNYTSPIFYSGGIIGCNNSGTITNCYNTGSINSTINIDSTQVDYYFVTADVGGVVGHSNGASIENCHNKATINAKTYNKSDSGYTFASVGGIVGNSERNINITSCSNEGIITTDITGFVAMVNAGGITGNSANTQIIKCYNTSNITASVLESAGEFLVQAGGITGINSDNNSISDCFNTGNISTQNLAKAELGGISGMSRSRISNCYNTGEIISPTSAVISTGPIVGLQNSVYENILNCYYLGDSEKDAIAGTIFKSELQFRSGEVAWLLNTSNKNLGDIDYSHSGIWSNHNNRPVFSDADYKTIYKVAISGALNENNYVISGCRMKLFEEGYSFKIKGIPFDPSTQKIISDLAVTSQTTVVNNITVETVQTANSIAAQYTNCVISAFDKNGNPISNDKPLGTGMTVTIQSVEMNGTKTIVLMGDVNGDAKVDAVDFNAIRNTLNGSVTLDGVYFKAGDIHKDGMIDAIDAYKSNLALS